MLSLLAPGQRVHWCGVARLLLILFLSVCAIHAQTSVSANPSSLTFTCPNTGGPQPSQITSTPSGAAVGTPSVMGTGPGVSATVPAGAKTPTSVSVSVDCTGL